MIKILLQNLQSKSFFIGSFFTKTNLASLIGVLAYFVSYLPFILVMSLKYEMNFATKFALVFFTRATFIFHL